MDLYTIFKFLHVVAALAWVGGGITLFAQSLFAIREKGELETIRSLNVVAAMGKRWFIPASLLTVVFGIIVATLGGMWGELWVILGLVGFAATFLTGLLVFEPNGKAMGEAAAAGDDKRALKHGKTLLQASKFDFTVLFVVVADMVFKPGWSDWPILGLMVLVLVVAAAIFLRPLFMPGAVASGTG